MAVLKFDIVTNKKTIFSFFIKTFMIIFESELVD